MRLYSFMTNPEQFNIDTKEKDLNKKYVPNETATVESVCDAFEFIIACEDNTNTIVYDEKKLIEALTLKMKSSNWYKNKSKQEQEEILNYIKENTEPDNPFYS